MKEKLVFLPVKYRNNIYVTAWCHSTLCQHCVNPKYHGASNNAKQVAYLNVSLVQTKVYYLCNKYYHYFCIPTIIKTRAMQSMAYPLT
jgi:hypothetical protein